MTKQQEQQQQQQHGQQQHGQHEEHQHYGQQKKKGGRKEGQQNYNEKYVKVLLDIIDDILPLGNNQWGIITDEFEASRGRVKRDLDSLKVKLDKLAATKKPTGDPSCPPLVRKSKHIARDILARANAGTFGSSVDEALDEREYEGESSESLIDGSFQRNQNTITKSESHVSDITTGTQYL